MYIYLRFLQQRDKRELRLLDPRGSIGPTHVHSLIFTDSFSIPSAPLELSNSDSPFVMAFGSSVLIHPIDTHNLKKTTKKMESIDIIIWWKVLQWNWWANLLWQMNNISSCYLWYLPKEICSAMLLHCADLNEQRLKMMGIFIGSN